MGRSKGAAAAARRKKAAAVRKANAPKISDGPKVNDDASRSCPSLPSDLLANIHDRLVFLDRVAFAAVFAASCDDDVFKPYAPWLVLPGNKPETVQLFSIADRRGATVPAPEPALRDHFIVGSSRGWFATADLRGQIYLVNPSTGEQHELPHVSTMGVFQPKTYYHWFTLEMNRFLPIRFGHGPPFDHCWSNSMTHCSGQMRTCFFRKVVLSSSPRPDTYAAMLISNREVGAPAFASAEDPKWRLAPSYDGVEDAIHHDGKFYSVSYSGVVEAWERDAESGAYTSTAVAPRLDLGEPKEEGQEPSCRKYLAAAPGRRLMVVIKYSGQVATDRYGQTKWSCSFKVHVLGDDGEWKETRDIGELALFVGMNNSLCLPTIGRPQIKAGCVYYTDDELLAAEQRQQSSSSSYSYGSRDEFDLRDAGMYSLKDGAVKKIEALGKEQRSFYPPTAWITPSIP